MCVCVSVLVECVPDTRLQQHRGGSADSCRADWLVGWGWGSAMGLCVRWRGVKLVPKCARPGIKMWQLDKRAQVMRSFQSDLSVWRWSGSVHPHQQLLSPSVLSLFLSLHPRATQKHNCAAFVFDCYVCNSGCMCQWTCEGNMWKSDWFSVSHCLKPFSTSLLLSVRLLCLPSPPLVQESKSELMTFSVFLFLFFVVLSPGDLFALNRSRGRDTE